MCQSACLRGKLSRSGAQSTACRVLLPQIDSFLYAGIAVVRALHAGGCAPLQLISLLVDLETIKPRQNNRKTHASLLHSQPSNRDTKRKENNLQYQSRQLSRNPTTFQKDHAETAQQTWQEKSKKIVFLTRIFKKSYQCKKSLRQRTLEQIPWLTVLQTDSAVVLVAVQDVPWKPYAETLFQNMIHQYGDDEKTLACKHPCNEDSKASPCFHLEKKRQTQDFSKDLTNGMVHTRNIRKTNGKYRLIFAVNSRTMAEIAILVLIHL